MMGSKSFERKHQQGLPACLDSEGQLLVLKANRRAGGDVRPLEGFESGMGKAKT